MNGHLELTFIWFGKLRFVRLNLFPPNFFQFSLYESSYFPKMWTISKKCPLYRMTFINLQWFSAISNDSAWSPLVICDFQWFSVNFMIFRDLQWYFVISNDFLWSPIIFCDLQWCSVIYTDSSWSPMVICDLQWLSVIFSNYLWSPIIFYDLQFFFTFNDSLLSLMLIFNLQPICDLQWFHVISNFSVIFNVSLWSLINIWDLKSCAILFA